ncbi:OmpP1/FadL family transporter [Thiomicrorhabdus xiamenensis]|uniref:Outer membrane protein transport protein n=1 Tax=Thiomicrorhabdus xiamenensis TaxID=2739063 RepID=A0A7D4THF0_9GAMM|nr:outer membrane protein transport protein [Thiomicrorhabdus xiamenensis]QKI90268.1 outer membrane protein transport protein [Thiomicrorhabdus xiamenensis]
MRKTKLALAIAASTIISTPAFATNGDVLIGLGAQARALGGTGTAAFFGSENALTNPALLGKSQGSEFSIGGTIFMPNVEANGSQSDNDLNIIPEVSMSTRINENLTFGLGMFGSAGMGVDYRDDANLMNAYSNLQLMKFAPTLAFNQDNFGLGFSPVIQYGALDINYDGTALGGGPTGNGMSTDIGYGFNLGGYFDITPEFTVALSYQSAIEMEYKDQISVAAAGFGQTMTDKLEQPEEFKIGASYTMGNWLMTADFKQIMWSKAEGYKDFNWQDQDVYALGAKYSGNNYWVGIGYNYGKDPIDVYGAGAGQIVDMFNNVFFPGIVESHFTAGAGVNLTKNSAIDFALVYADEVSKTIDVSTLMGPGATETTKHSQTGFTVAYRMNF